MFVRLFDVPTTSSRRTNGNVFQTVNPGMAGSSCTLLICQNHQQVYYSPILTCQKHDQQHTACMLGCFILDCFVNLSQIIFIKNGKVGHTVLIFSPQKRALYFFPMGPVFTICKNSLLMTFPVSLQPYSLAGYMTYPTRKLASSDPWHA